MAVTHMEVAHKGGSSNQSCREQPYRMATIRGSSVECASGPETSRTIGLGTGLLCLEDGTLFSHLHKGAR